VEASVSRQASRQQHHRERYNKDKKTIHTDILLPRVQGINKIISQHI